MELCEYYNRFLPFSDTYPLKTCGKELYRDFDQNIDPESLRNFHHDFEQQKFFTKENSTGEQKPTEELCDSLDDSGIGNSQPRDVQTVPDRSGNQPHTTKMPSLRNTGKNLQLSPQVGCKTSPTRQGQPTKPKYLELCINTGQYSTSLGEIDLSHVKSDGELFLKI